MSSDQWEQCCGLGHPSFRPSQLSARAAAHHESPRQQGTETSSRPIWCIFSTPPGSSKREMSFPFYAVEAVVLSPTPLGWSRIVRSTAVLRNCRRQSTMIVRDKPICQTRLKVGRTRTHGSGTWLTGRGEGGGGRGRFAVAVAAAVDSRHPFSRRLLPGSCSLTSGRPWSTHIGRAELIRSGTGSRLERARFRPAPRRSQPCLVSFATMPLTIVRDLHGRTNRLRARRTLASLLTLSFGTHALPSSPATWRWRWRWRWSRTGRRRRRRRPWRSWWRRPWRSRWWSRPWRIVPGAGCGRRPTPRSAKRGRLATEWSICRQTA